MDDIKAVRSPLGVLDYRISKCRPDCQVDAMSGEKKRDS
jgi:hypothetical protein